MTRRKPLVGAVTVAVAVTLVLGGILAVAVWREPRQAELSQAAALLPADTLRASWTDWAGIRAELGIRLDEDSTGPELRAFTDRAFDRDLSAASSLADSAVALQKRFGFSPATADWELYGQSAQGAVMLLHLPDASDFDNIADRLRGLGYREPARADAAWRGGVDLVPSIDPTLTPELQYVALLADQHLVLASDTESYLTEAVRSASGAGDHLEIDDLADHVDDPLAAVAFVGDFACTALTMAQADDEDRQVAQQLVADSGGVSPLSGLLVVARPDRDLRLVMAFESDDQARTNARSRATLATGEAPGKGGDFTDRFTVTSAASRGSQAILDLTARPGAFALSDLTTGPVLPETC